MTACLHLFEPARKPWGIFSPCRQHTVCAESCLGRPYRYVLSIPTGIDNDRVALWALANPSKATPEKLDPTVERTVDYSRRWGFGWSCVVNARGWRETNPKLVPPDPEAIGPENDRYIVEQAELATIVVCGWGKLGGQRGLAVLELLRGAGAVPHALKLNKDGSPQHPLYPRADAVPFPMEVARA